MTQTPPLFATVLVVDDDESIRTLLCGRLERRGHKVFQASSAEQAVAIITQAPIESVICDIRMPGKGGFHVLEASRVPTIMITGHGDKEAAIRSVKLGAFSFFEKPFDLDQLELTLLRAVERFRWEKERGALLEQLAELCRLQNREIQSLESQHSSQFIGKAPAVLTIKNTLVKLAKKPEATVLILGETGTGKEVLARELHEHTHGDSQHTPFLALNCAAIPQELLESELFGHEKGSFTGAHQQRIGLCEAVRGGTLFLDEIGEMDIKLQAKLLRLVQERSFRRVGGTGEIGFRGRIVAATHRDLVQRISQNLFREDLFYRLNVITLALPPLRERREDLPDLIDSLCRKQRLKGVSPERMADVVTHNWPGNIRELRNWIERASILAEHDRELLVTAEIPGFHAPELAASEDRPLVNHVKTAEREAILGVLRDNDYHLTRSAAALGIDRKTLHRKMKALQITIKNAA